MEFNFCNQYGFNPSRIQERLELVQLRSDDLQLGLHLQHSTIHPHIEKIVDGFYLEMLRHPIVRHFLHNPELISTLRKTQQKYLLTLGLGFNEPRYFEDRLRIGHVHARVGIPLNLYVCAYRLMTQLIQDAIPPEIRSDRRGYDQLCAFLHKIAALDTSLAIDTYFQSKVHDLEVSIETLKEEEHHLRHLARTDALTRLINHAALDSALVTALATAQRDNSSLCIAMADLDHFKQINDNHGHLVGDSVLRDVAARLSAAVRGADLLGRYGGEEFMVIFANTSLATARKIAERVRRSVCASPIQVQDISIHVTISIGLTVMTPGDTVPRLLERADSALYAAKKAGRDRIAVMNPTKAQPIPESQ